MNNAGFFLIFFKDGLYRFKRLMFGLKNAPTEYQKIMVRIFNGIEGVLVFLDDILVFGKTKEKHDQRLDIVLRILEENEFCMNRGKCLFAVTELIFLGWHISGQGISPTADKVEAIKNFRKPETVEEVRSFLGLVNFVGHCIPDLATKTFHLRELIKKGETFKWTEERTKAFEELKKVLCNGSVLGFFDPGNDTILIVDASPVGLGAVLVQLNKGKEQIISFASKSLSDVERRYCQTEREALSIVFGVERFKYYLFGREFLLYTDCKPLEFLFGEKSKPCARIERWVLRIQCFRFKIRYKPGKMNIADSLSRLGKLNEQGLIDKSFERSLWLLTDYLRPVAIDLVEIKEKTAEDVTLSTVKSALENGTWKKSVEVYKSCEFELCWVEGVLLRGHKIVIPDSLRDRTLKLAHESHQGIVAMKGRLRAKVWWPGIDKDVEKFVKNCKECLLVSLPNHPEPLYPTKFPEAAWEAIALDFKGPLPTGDYLLVIIDYFSKFTIIEPMKSISVANLETSLRKVFASFGPPASIRLDNGPQLNCEEFKSFCREFGIKLIFSTPYWPQANGEVERMNRTIGKRLQISRATDSDWKKDIQTYLLNYHSTPHATTGETPGELMMKRRLRDKLPQVCEPKSVNMEEVRDKIMQRKEKMKEYVDKKRRAEKSDIQEGDEVVLWNMRKRNKLDTNFSPNEHVVVEKQGGEVTVKSKVDGSVKKRNITHVKKLGKDDKRPDEQPHLIPQENHEIDPHTAGVEASYESKNQKRKAPAEEPVSRPKRNAKLPARFM